MTIRAIALLSAAIIVGACTEPDQQVESPTTPVIIYLVDTLRADRIGVYGYKRRSTSPNIDALAAQSVVFERAYAPAPWTMPSVASLNTSRFACEHGVTSVRKKLNSSIIPLPEKLLNIGYYTGSLYFNPMIGPYSGFDRGYDEYIRGAGTTNRLTDELPAFLDHAGDRPFFLNVHTMEPHDVYWTPYSYVQTFGHISPDVKTTLETSLREFNAASLTDFLAERPPGTTDTTAVQSEALMRLDAHREEFDLLYDASVLWADHNAGEVIEELKQRGVWDKSIFIFLADHGEELGERGGWFHGHSVYEEVVRVPLLIHFPGDQYAGLRISSPVSLVDLLPTILDYLKQPGLCKDCRGRSVLPMINDSGSTPPHTVVIPSLRLNEPFYYLPWRESRGNVNVVVLQDAWKGIWNDDLENLELYDLDSDPGERVDLSRENVALTRQMTEAARQWLGNCRQVEQMPEETEELDEATKEQLRAVGYFD
jgi:arylsulfatase A-like enzyme